MAIPRQLVEDAPNPALEESAQIDEAASGSPQPTPEDILGTPNLDSTGDQLVGQGLGMQKNVMNSGPTDALLTGLNNQGKINAVGQAGAMQFHDRKYDNAASQKIYDDLNAQRSTQSANRQKTADSLLSKGLGLKKESRDIASDSIRSKLDKSKLKVQEGTEGSQIEEAGNRAKQSGLANQDLEQRIAQTATEFPEKMKALKVRTQIDIDQARRLNKMDRKLTPTLAEEYSRTLGIPVEKAAGLTYEDAELLMKNKSHSNEKTARFNEAQVTKYSNTLKDLGIPELEDALETTEATLKKYKGKDLPGVGATGVLPDIMVSQDGRNFRQDTAKLVNSILFGRGGKNLTKTERDAIERELGTGSAWNDENIERGMVLVRKAFERIKQDANAGYAPEVVDEYISRGGRDFRTKSSNTFPRTVKNAAGDITTVDDEKELKEATAAGFN